MSLLVTCLQHVTIFSCWYKQQKATAEHNVTANTPPFFRNRIGFHGAKNTGSGNGFFAFTSRLETTVWKTVKGRVSGNKNRSIRKTKPRQLNTTKLARQPKPVATAPPITGPTKNIRTNVGQLSFQGKIKYLFHFFCQWPKKWNKYLIFPWKLCRWSPIMGPTKGGIPKSPIAY